MTQTIAAGFARKLRAGLLKSDKCEGQCDPRNPNCEPADHYQPILERAYKESVQVTESHETEVRGRYPEILEFSDESLLAYADDGCGVAYAWVLSRREEKATALALLENDWHNRPN